jgi:hypothetical protein
MIHYVILSQEGLDRKYTLRGHIMVDANIHDIGADILRVVGDQGFTHISLLRDVTVEGRSWEMAASKAAQGITGVYSGTVESYDGVKVIYGAVPYLHIKNKLYDNIKHSGINKYDILSR